MASRVTKTRTLGDIAKELKPPRQRTWFDSLDVKHQAELLEVRELYRNKELQVGTHQLYTVAIEKIPGMTCSRETFSKWMREAK